jgi:hypothetical protein
MKRLVTDREYSLDNRGVKDAVEIAFGSPADFSDGYAGKLPRQKEKLKGGYHD